MNNRDQLLRSLFWLIFILISVGIRSQSITIKVYPDSVVHDVSNKPVGINLDFFMDGGRFPHAKYSVKDALQKMGVKYLRYPGGEKSDLYLFSIPPYSKSVPTLARTAGLGDYPGVITGKGTFTYDPLDFDEFMAICRSIHAEPVIVVAADNYLLDVKPGERLSTRGELIRNAAEWVRYANIKKRYGVRHWMIGNESWNANNVHSTAEIYAHDVIDFSRAMKAVDSSILIIANGASDEFFKTVITKAGNAIDRLCVSNYGVYHFFRGYDTYRDTTQVLIWPAMTAIDAVKKYGTKAQKERLKIIVAEFGSIDWANYWKGTNDMGHAIVTFDMAGQLLMQPAIEYSCFWNTRWIENESKPGADYDALDKNGNLNPTGYAMMIWGKFLGSNMVKSGPVGQLVTYASTDKNKLFLYLINKAAKEQVIKVDMDGYKIDSVLQSWEYFGKDSEDTKPVWQKKKRLAKDSYTLKGFSITVMEYKISKGGR